MADRLKEEQLTLLEKMERSMTGMLNRPSQAFKDIVEAFEKIINLGRKPVNQTNAYQYVLQHEQLMENTQDYIRNNRGARTERGKERLGYAGQVMTMMAPRKLEGLRDPRAVERLGGRTLDSLTDADFPVMAPSSFGNRERRPEAPSVISHQGVQRWFTPMESGGNKNIAAGRLGALLGLQSVTGSDQKTMIPGKGEGSIQSVSKGFYIHDISDVKMGVSYKDEGFQKDMAGLTLIRYLTGNTNREVDSLVINQEMAGTAPKGRQEVKLTGIRDTDHSFSFGTGSIMDVSEIKVVSREVADNLKLINKDMLRHTLKDVLTEEQIDQLGSRMEKVKKRLGEIKIVEDGKWDEEAQTLNKHSPVYPAMVRLLGPEPGLVKEESIITPAPEAVIKSAVQEAAAPPSSGEKKEAPAAEHSAEPAKEHVPGTIPPPPPLPEIKTVSFRELQAEENKTQSGVRVRPTPPKQAQNPREAMLEELKAVIKKRNENTAANTEPEKKGTAAPDHVPSEEKQVNLKPLSRKKGIGM